MRVIMSEREIYERKLVNISPRQWETFLKEHSNLPGPKTNLELAQAFARVGTLMDFKKFAKLDYSEAPENTPAAFLTICGVLGLGRYLAEYHDSGLFQILQERANDSRPQIREAVSLALQTIGEKNVSRSLKYAKVWVEGSYFEQRAAVTALCKPDILTDRKICLETLDLLDWVTASMMEDSMENDEGFQSLKEALGYCWSVAVAALPEKGKPMMERWIKEEHPIINNIMRKNLKKKRLTFIEPEWTQQWIRNMSG